MKPCKYCKNLGRFYPALGKVLYQKHAEYQNQFRTIWEAIASLQLEEPRSR